MHRSVVRLFLVVAVAIPALLVALPALAQYPPDGDADTTPDASFACDGLVEGSTATCSIGGWEPDSEVSVTVTADETAVLNDTITADGNGFVSYSFDLPEGTESLQFTHSGVLADGTPHVHTAVQDVAEAGEDDTATPAPGGLPSTGEMISLLLVVAVLTLGVGIVAVRRGRTRADAGHGA